MTNKISPREWEAISAYLDGQLGPRERSRLEARMQTDPELQVALEQMRRTQAVLRSQPKIRAPRNFTLTPEMVGVRRAPRAYPYLRLASALAGLLLVLVFVGDLFSGAPRIAATTSFEAPMEYQAEEPAGVAGAPIPGGMGGGAGGRGEGGGGGETGAGGAAEETEAPAAEMEAFLKNADRALGEATPEAVEEAPSIAALPAQATPALDATPEATAQAEIAQGEQPPENVLRSQPPAELQAEQQEVRRTAGLINETTIRIIEIALAVIAVITGLAALYLRRVKMR